MPEEVLLTVAGLHVPATPLSEVEGRVGTLLPEHMVTLVPKLKVGVTFGFTVTSKFTGVAHKPADGVKVYVPEEVLLTAEGLHVPVIPFAELAGKEGTPAPEQIVNDVPKSNEGVIFGLTVTLKLAGKAHWPASGVKV